MWGRTFYSNNYAEIPIAQQNGVRVLVLDDDAENYRRMGCTVVSVLLPPFEAIEAELNGDVQTASAIYVDYLQNMVCSQVLATISAALFSGKDVMFFISPDEAKNMDFGYTFTEFIDKVFGYVPGNISFPNSGIGELNEQTLSNRLDLLYLQGYISIETYLSNYPGIIPQPLCWEKLLIDYGVNPSTIAPEQIQNAIMVLVRNVRDFVNQRNQINKDTAQRETPFKIIGE